MAELDKKNALKSNRLLAASVALTVGVGIAIGGSIGSYLIGILICIPLGVALLKNGVKAK